MRPPITYFARVFIEFPNGFRVGTGSGDDKDDDLILTDANGLPFIPGTSLTGAFLDRLRFMKWDVTRLKSLFGYQNSSPNSGSPYPDGQGSRLTLSHAHLLNAQGIAMDGVPARFTEYLPNRVTQEHEFSPQTAPLDRFLSSAITPTLRDHVRINDRGVADARGKFTRSHVPGGHRFAFDITLEGDESDSQPWSDLLDVWKAAEFRIGGATRQGFGRFITVVIRSVILDLRKPEDWASWQKLPVQLNLSETVLTTWTHLTPQVPPRSPSSIRIQLKLQAQGFWMFGGNEKANGISPLEGPVPFKWKDKSNGKMAASDPQQVKLPALVIPFTGVKGPLRHRLTYHYNRLVSDWANPSSGEERLTPGEQAARQLFGWASDQPRSNDGRRGVFVGEDIHPASTDVVHTKKLDHVALDPFTGGPIPGALFSETPQWKGEFTWGFEILDPQPLLNDPKLLKALIATLTDLANGDLTLGKGAGKGRFTVPPETLDAAILPLTQLIQPEENIP